jgi:hypothetical protein
MAFGPWPLKLIAKPKIQGKRIGYTPCVVEVKRAIYLLPRGECGNDHLSGIMVVDIAEIVSVAQ